MAKKKIVYDIKVNQTKFENISYDQWVKLIPDILNYDLQLSNIERLNFMLKRQKQLEVYLACRGLIPSQYLYEVNELNDAYNEIKKIKKDHEIQAYDQNFKSKSVEELQALEQKISYEFVKNGVVLDDKPAYFYFQNPYFLEGDQRFERRLKVLKNELKDLKWIIKYQLKPSLKRSLNMLDLIAYNIRRNLNIKEQNATIEPLINFVRPFVDEIINSDDYYYQELLARSL